MNQRLMPVIEKAPYVASGGLGIAAFTMHDWAVIIGLVLTVVTFVFNIWYKLHSLKVLKQRVASGEPLREGDLKAFIDHD